MPKIWSWNAGSSGGGEGGAPSGPAGGSLKGEYPNPTLAAEAVKAEYIETGAVTEGKLASEAVTAAKIKTDAVIAAKIKEEAVETAKIKNLAVTAAKLAGESVETAKIKLLAVEAGQLGAESVEASKIKGEAVTEAKIATGAVTAGKLGAAAVEESKIKAKAVSKEKLSTEVQELIEPKVMERSFAIAGEVKNEEYPGFYVKLGTGEEKKLIGAEFRLLGGTSVKLEVLKNGTGIASYKSTELEALKTEAKSAASSKALSDKDLITLKPSGGAGTPTGLICTLFIESVK